MFDASLTQVKVHIQAAMLWCYVSFVVVDLVTPPDTLVLKIIPDWDDILAKYYVLLETVSNYL